MAQLAGSFHIISKALTKSLTKSLTESLTKATAGLTLAAGLPLLVTIGLLAVTPARAADWVVNPTGVGDDFPTIQAAISSPQVADGDAILLRDGTYTGAGNRDIDFSGKNVVVRSLNLNPQNCVIDCQGSSSAPHRGFLIYQGEGTGAGLQSIKIVNGHTLNAPGAGILIEGSSSPLISNCIIQSCTAEGSSGGGIHCGGTSAPVIANCQILSNLAGGAPAGHGGGIHAHVWATPVINGCTITGNRAVSSIQGPVASGGGIYIHGGNIDYCVVTNNQADTMGGGIRATGAQIAFCDIWSNTAQQGAEGCSSAAGG